MNAPFPRHPVLGVTPFERPDPTLTAALTRAGETGVLDFGHDLRRGLAALGEAAALARDGRGAFGIRLHRDAMPPPDAIPPRVDLIVLPPGIALSEWAAEGRRLVVRVTDCAQAAEARRQGADALIVAGSEAGGACADDSTFILLQRIVREIDLPVWAEGGIGLHTCAAAIVAGASGVVLVEQLARVRECKLPSATLEAIEGTDGSETQRVAGRRLLSRPGLAPLREAGGLTALEIDSRCGGDDPQHQLVPCGQAIAFAAGFAERFETAGGVVAAIRRELDAHLAALGKAPAIAENAALALEHGTRFPIVQGPMTRVSDNAAFADDVSRGGALPFLALALMPAEAVERLVRETADRLAGRPWGVGILGFVPAELRAAQLAALEAAPPPFAIIAGGRPSQARSLEAKGTRTYLHVPSPGLLELFLSQGSRRFIFEGFECGGHVGPRSSLALWESQLQILSRFERPQELSLLFAGGIHDGRSAAAVEAMTAPLAARGARIGVLMGTAYLFTEEAVRSGAILDGYQRMALDCSTTALLETAPGHATRCIRNDYVETFDRERSKLEAEGVESREAWARLEQLNLGRLRIASKGLRRDGARLVDVDDQAQRREGMYMIGQVAALRDAVTSVEALHRSLIDGARERLASFTVRTPPIERPLDVAIVGMACIFPGAPDLERFWSNVVRGVDSVTEVPQDRWSTELYYDPKGEPGIKTPSKWGGFLDPIAFDPALYGIPPKSLAAIEPIQLLSLEIARRALHDAGYARRWFDRERCGVIFGAEGGTELAAGYGFRAMFPQYAGALPAALDAALPRPTEDSFPGLLANVIAGRIANRLDLGGKNFTVDAACASSLAALDVAVESLTAGSADMYIVGGADTHNSIGDYLMFSSVHALSATGLCRAFDRKADGITLGEGVAALVLKRRVDAERDGDRIYAVIRGLGGSSDGRSLGLTAPRKEGQMRALERAYAQAGVSPSEVGLVEAHGTGTVVGDRTELETLETIFAGAPPASCNLGSVKSQIGHTKCAAGLAAMIKAALAVHRRVLPPTLHIDQPNPAYNSGRSPFYFSDRARPWLAERRVAGMSAFGFGGTNFHAIIAGHEPLEPPQSGMSDWPCELFVIRAADRAEARRRMQQLAAVAASPAPCSLRDLAFTCATSGSGPVQVACVAASRAELIELLERAERFEADGKRLFVAEPTHARADGKLAFVFPGQGSQRTGMLAELFIAFPELQSLAADATDVAAAIWPEQCFGDDAKQRQRAALTDTRAAQPALGLAGMAMAQLLDSLGVEPQMLAGHSYGELSALCRAGAIPESALQSLSRSRAAAMLEATGDDPGTMLAVNAAADKLEAFHADLVQVVAANRNAPQQTVLSGPTADIERVHDRLRAAGIGARRIPVACAFHSGLMRAASARFAGALESVDVRPPALPVYANLSAQPYPPDPAAIRALLSDQLCSPVRFQEQIEAMYEDGARIFVEVGPGGVIGALISKILEGRPVTVLSTDSSSRGGLEQLQCALAALAALQLPLKLDRLHRGRGCRTIDLDDPAVREQPELAWNVSGHRAWPIRGELPAGAMRPLTRPPESLSATAVPDSNERAVVEYLQNLREMAEAQRQVMLRLVGGAATPAERVVQREPTVEAEPLGGEDASATAQPIGPPLPATAVDLREGLLAIVSARTGYPVEMLDLDLDLEADLSIDSIKRIEILGALNEQMGAVNAESDESEALVEELARIKTLRGILDWLQIHREGIATPSAPPADTAALLAPLDDAVRRYLLEVKEVPAAPTNGRPLAGRTFAISHDPQGVGLALARLLEESGAVTRSVQPGRKLARVDGLVDLSALEPGSGPAQLKRLFRSAQQAVGSGAEVILAATALGGDFGRHGHGVDRGENLGGHAGMLKSLFKEQPDCHVRAVDLDPAESPGLLARHLFDELLAEDDHVEVGYREGRRRVLRVVESGGEGAGRPELDRESVVLITGGARGIAAEIAIQLARQFGCALELVGRSQLPERSSLDEETVGAADLLQVKRLLAARGGCATPIELEQRARELWAEVEIRRTLRSVSEAGSEVRYHSVDVRKGREFGRVIEGLYRRRGRIDGVIHAAGIIEDKLFLDKSSESFDRVFDTKVNAALTLSRKLRDDAKFVVFFSSVSGAFGNRGQADYAAANDLLDKLAHRLNRRIAGRVLSVNWGPWDSQGMVTPGLRKEYQRLGIALIPLESGVESLIRELGQAATGPAQVIFMSADPASMR